MPDGEWVVKFGPFDSARECADEMRRRVLGTQDSSVLDYLCTRDDDWALHKRAMQLPNDPAFEW